MAGFRTHLSVSALLGAAAGMYGVWQWQLDWAPVFLAAGLGALGGMLPDLDSDSGVPVRELFGLAAAFIPILFMRRLRRLGLTHDELLVILLGSYLLVRYGAGALLKRITVHRGMFHSIPGMFVAGLAVFVLYDHDELALRYYMAGSVMLGFLSHLVLDEIYAVDLRGLIPRLNQFAGSALKFFSASWTANAVTYTLLVVLAGAAFKSMEPPREGTVRAPITPRQGAPFSFPSWQR
jgi:hypothetical protein